MSAPLKTMRPESVASTPAICAMSVVLPAPFGPMSAWTSPCAISSVTSSVATSPPKRLVTPRSSSIFLPEEPGDALGREHHDGQQHRAHREPGMVLVVGRRRRQPADAVIGDEVLEAEQDGRADQAAPQRADAAED